MRPVCYLMYKYHSMFKTFYAHYMLVCSFSIQVKWGGKFQTAPFITETWNLGESTGMFFRHTNKYILHHVLNPVKRSLKILCFFLSQLQNLLFCVVGIA